MKTQLLLAFLTAAAGSVQADIILGAPGVPVGARVAAQVPFIMEYQLVDSYKFVFTGIEAKGDTLGAPGASGTQGHGGQFNLKAMVSDNNGSPRVREGNLYFRDVQEFNTAPLQTLLTTPAVVFKAVSNPITITTQWQGNGNAHKPNGIFNIVGEYQKDPPTPTGSLSFDVGRWTLADNPTPEGMVSIIRE
jgi:hypothetical protein